MQQRFGRRINLVYGANTMTFNRQPRGRLLRYDKMGNFLCDFDLDLGHELAALLNLSSTPTNCPIGATQSFRDAVITAVDRTFDKEKHFAIGKL